MKILLVGSNLENYLAKTHAAFQHGLRSMLAAQCYGEGFPGYDPNLKTYQEIIAGACRDNPPDVVFGYNSHSTRYEDLRFAYGGFENINALTATLICDYWAMTDRYREQFEQWLLDMRVGLIVSYYPQFMDLIDGSPLRGRTVWIPPTFDSELFNDWGLSKQFDVGFVGSGVHAPEEFYPERFAIHQKLLRHPGIRYHSPAHPGWGYHDPAHQQVGRGFSRLINSCRMFVATGGRLNLPLARYFETLASKTVLLAVKPIGAEALGLIDGVNYVEVTPANVNEKVDHYLRRPELCDQIAEAGYLLAMSRHNCFQRALEFYGAAKNFLRQRPHTELPLPDRSAVAAAL